MTPEQQAAQQMRREVKGQCTECGRSLETAYRDPADTARCVVCMLMELWTSDPVKTP